MFWSLLWAQLASYACTLILYFVNLVWTGRTTFADPGDSFFFCVSGGRCWNLGVFHEYLSFFCITDRSTLPQQTPKGFISLCRGQVLSWAKLTFWQIIELMFWLCTPLAGQLMQHTTVTYNLSIHQNLSYTILWCFLDGWINALIQTPLESVRRLS